MSGLLLIIVQPIPMGACTGVTSLCAIGGFALETRCHLGQVILYDTVGQLGWSVDVRNHPIKVVIDKVLSDDSAYRVQNGKEDASLLTNIIRWGWRRRKGSDEDGKDPETSLPEVPLPRPAHEVEGEEGVCTVCVSAFLGS